MTPGARRLFITSNVMTIVVAGMHTMGAFSPPQTEEAERLMRMMQGFAFEAMGMTWSMHDVLLGLALTMTVFLITLAAINAVVLWGADASPRVLSRIATVEAVAMWVLAALYGTYQIPPPFLSFLVLGALYTASAVGATRSANQAEHRE